MINKTTMAVLGFAASSIATAGTMGPVCTPGNVTVPCEARHWELGAQALYLQSMYSGAKAYQTVITGPTTTEPAEVRNDWDWGYRLQGAYHFNTGNDITVNWMHFSTTATKENVMVQFPLRATLYDSNRIDQVNVVLGQKVDVSAQKKMRFYGGLQLVDIQSNINNVYASHPAFNRLFDDTDFKGIGPTLGVDYAYELVNGLSLTANTAGSVVTGTSRYHAGLVTNQYGIIYAQKYLSAKATVPSLEAKLGVNYVYPVVDGAFQLDVGYQVVNYFNPLFAQKNQTMMSTHFEKVNYGAMGPYFGLKYVGNA